MSAFSQKLSQKQLQTMSLSYGMKLSISLLQLNSLQLKEFLEKELMENPLYEIDFFEPSNVHYHQDFDIADEQHSLQEELLLQINDKHLNLGILEMILQNCDGNGYLLVTKEELADKLHSPLPQVEYVLELIHQCMPYGIASKDLSECLYLQLKQMYPDHTLAQQLVIYDLQDIAKNRMEKLAQKYHVEKQAIKEAILLIQTLDPRPASSYDMEHIQFVKPDVILKMKEEELQIIMPHYFNIKEYDYDKGYDFNKEDKHFIKEKREQGKVIIDCLNRRKETLYAIMSVLVEVQQGHLRYQKPLNYLRMVDVAEALSVHESTISRAMKDKYYEYNGIVYPMKNLLCKQVHKTSVDSIYLMLRKLIEQEDRHAPLSDRQLSECLKEQGITCSRRTIAKYRMEHHIPNTQTRRRWKEKIDE
ncbi:RNA polymerase factor sigma-54 [[Eubacterium] hominis]|uniref:RNA polymerase factor sigma-54 n=1 Tax=[Eubacterium] hominis TaxID=2764325 RepID=UPI003A4D2EFD